MIGPAASLPQPRELLPRAADAPAARQAVARAVAPPPVAPDQAEPMPGTLTFREFLAALNPLHHIPGVSWVYRQITGETIQPVFRVLGGLVMGGPIGAVASAVGALAEHVFRGRDGTTALAAAPEPAITTRMAEAPASGAGPVAFANAAGTALQPLPIATRLAARAYPAPPPREATTATDPAAGFVPAAAAHPSPARAMVQGAATTDAPPALGEPAPSAPAGAPARIRRAPIVPITSGGQDPAFVQRMMQGLEAYERAMRARNAPATPAIPATRAAP